MLTKCISSLITFHVLLVLYFGVHVSTWHNKNINSLSHLMQMSSTVNCLPFGSNFILACFKIYVVKYIRFSYMIHFPKAL